MSDVARIGGRRGQFYLFAALILISSVFMAISNSSSISVKQTDDLESYRDNYMYEARLVANRAILTGQNLSDSLRNYTEIYLDYTASKNLDIGVVYMFTMDEKIHIVNYLKDPILISAGTTEHTVSVIEERVMDRVDELTIELDDEAYTYTFLANDIEFKTLFVGQNG